MTLPTKASAPPAAALQLLSGPEIYAMAIDKSTPVPGSNGWDIELQKRFATKNGFTVQEAKT